MQYSQLLQGWQKGQYSRIALRAPRTWLVSLGTFVISSLLIAATLALRSHLYVVFPPLFASPFSKLLGGIVVVPLLFFFFSLSFALFTNRAHKINAYRKALKKHLATSMNSYYSPEGALEVQKHLATLMRGNGLQREQE